MSNSPRSDRSMGPTETYPTLYILDTVCHAFFMHFSIEKGDRLVFCSDGLRSSLKEQGVPDQDVGNTIVSLAGMDLLDAEALLSYEKAIGHSFIRSADINNIADGMIRNILFGLDDHRMAKETMAIMNSRPDYLRDDMSVVVVEIL
jgi:pyruvate dehydrogenase phosphatase